MNRPNLFEYATSELSQDAFICWLLSWAREENANIDPALHKTALLLLDRLFKAAEQSPPKKYDSVEIDSQYKHIDVLVIVNGEYAIIIEDKTLTANHSDQLNRYRKEIEKSGHEQKAISSDKIIPIYFKTEDQSNYDDVKAKNYFPFLRRDFLQILDTEEARTIRNAIFVDYREHLRFIEEDVNSYKSKNMPLGKWSDRAWGGFFSKLQEHLQDGNWKHVSNRGGGFMGFLWHEKNYLRFNCRTYLHLEEEEVCFKIVIEDKEERRTARWEWYQSLRTTCEHPDFAVKIKKPRFRSGKWMTAAKLDIDDYRQVNEHGAIDIPRTVDLLKQAEEIMDAALSNS